MNVKGMYLADTYYYGTGLKDFSQMVYDMRMCWKCGKPIDGSTDIYRTSLCQTCGTPLHSCRNCKFYAPGHHYDCHESVDEEVTEKEESNFCENFSVRTLFSSGSIPDDSGKQARDAFNSLFGA